MYEQVFKWSHGLWIRKEDVSVGFALDDWHGPLMVYGLCGFMMVMMMVREYTALAYNNTLYARALYQIVT